MYPSGGLVSPVRAHPLLILTLAELFLAPRALAAQLLVPTPVDVTTCDPVDVTWSGGTAPYISTITCFGTNVLGRGSQIDPGFTWIPATVYAGCTTDVLIVDAVGDVVHSGSFTIAKGAGEACSDDVSINVTPPISGVASSTFTSTSTSLSTSSSPFPSSSSDISSAGATHSKGNNSKSFLPTSIASSSDASSISQTSGSTAMETTSSATSATSQSTPPPKKKSTAGTTAAAVVVPVVVLSPTVVIVFCCMRRRRRRRRQSVLGSKC